MLGSDDVARDERLSVGLGVRPPRIAIGVPAIRGISWPRLYELAIASQSRIWGGIANVPFPLTENFTDHPLFWALADRFDADAWTTYVVRVGDMATVDPAWLDVEESRLREQLVEYEKSVIDDYIGEHRETPVVDAAQPSEAQWREIVQRVAPFHGSESGLDWASTTAPRFPFVDVGEFAELPEAVRSPSTSLGSVMQLLMTAEVGRVVPEFEEHLGERGLSVDRPVLKSPHEVARLLFNRPHDEAATYPWALSELGLAHYRDAASPLFPRVVIVAGQSPWDFTLFYALRRWTSLAFWVPGWLRRSRRFLYRLFSTAHSWAARGSGEIVVVSASSETFRDEVVRMVREHGLRGVSVAAGDWTDVLPDEPNRLYERGNFGIPRQNVAVGAELPTPLPRRVMTRQPNEMRWLTEVNVLGWSPLRHPAVGKVALNAHGSEFQRTTRSGVAYFCPSLFFASAEELETVTVRPRLASVSVVEQLRAIVESAGWSCAVSDKGIWAQESAALFGGFDEVANALTQPGFRQLVDGYVNGKAGLELAGGRHFLSHRQLLKLLGDDTNSLLTRLVERRVLTRGLALRCRRCRQKGWYSLDDVGDEFRCGRCRLTQQSEGAWAGDAEPAWFYELAEVVHQFIEHDGDLPVLAIARQFDGSKKPLDRGVEIEFFPPGYSGMSKVDRWSVEIDVVVAEGHRLWLGEAATGLRPTKARLRTLRRVAQAVRAHGFLFATSEPQFPDASVETAMAEFAGSGVELAFVSALRSQADSRPVG